MHFEVKQIMEAEFAFRVVVIVLFIALAVIGVYHRTQAAKSEEKITRHKEGVLLMILLRLFGFSMWISLLICNYSATEYRFM